MQVTKYQYDFVKNRRYVLEKRYGVDRSINVGYNDIQSIIKSLELTHDELLKLTVDLMYEQYMVGDDGK